MVAGPLRIRSLSNALMKSSGPELGMLKLSWCPQRLYAGQITLRYLEISGNLHALVEQGVAPS